jgi:hypothetical protein
MFDLNLCCGKGNGALLFLSIVGSAWQAFSDMARISDPGV